MWRTGAERKRLEKLIRCAKKCCFGREQIALLDLIRLGSLNIWWVWHVGARGCLFTIACLHWNGMNYYLGHKSNVLQITRSKIVQFTQWMFLHKGHNIVWILILFCRSHGAMILHRDRGHNIVWRSLYYNLKNIALT